MKKQSSLSFLFNQAGNKKIYYVWSIVFAILSVVSGIVPYYLVSLVINELIVGTKDLWVYGKLVILMIVFFALKILFHSISTTISHGATFKTLANMRKNCTEKLSKMPLGEVQARPAGYLKSTIVERIDSCEIALAHVIPEFTSNLVPPIIILIMIFIINWKMGFVTLITLPIGMLFSMLMMVGYQKYFSRVMRATKNLNDASVEYIEGIEVIKVFGKSENSYEKFVECAKEGAESYVDWMRHNNFYFTIALVLMPATMISVLPIGAIFYMNHSITLNDLIIIIVYSVALIEPIITMFSYQDDMHQMDTIVGTVRDILDAPELIRPEVLDDNLKIKDATINLKDVHFAYQEKEVLHGINLDIKDGSYVALVGPSGSGKSTIAKLIASMWDVNSGEISFGGVNIKNIPLEQYEDYIAYVSQDNFLFNDTVMNNIRIGKTNGVATDEEVIDICKKSGVHDFIMSLEDGYQTMVGSKGGHLSGGERQRISIARAMLKDAPVVILDEATAYTDPENEALIQESVAKLVKDKTLIVIAHRLSTVSNADKIVLINDGNIECMGTHEELLEKSEMYKNMWNAHISVKDTKEEEKDA